MIEIFNNYKYMSKIIDTSKYLTWEQLISNLDKKIETTWKILKQQLKQDRENLQSHKKELAYV